MPVIIPPTYAQVIVNWRGDIFESGVGATVYAVDNSPDLVDNVLANTIATMWADEMLPDASEELTLSSVEVLTDTTGGEAIVEQQGEGTYALPPPNVAALVRKVTPARGRRAQGRMFLPGMVGETAIDNYGNIEAGAFNSLQANLNTLYAAHNSADLVPVILHNSEGETPPGPPNAITNFVLQAKVSTQRRRLR